MLAENGVDVSDITEEEKGKKEEPEKATPEKEPEETPEKTVDPDGETEGEPENELKETKEPRKRTIYDDYKEKKSELKSERELREMVERERDELKARLDAISNAETPKEKEEAQDEIDAFIASHKEWDKDAIKDLIAIAQKGSKPDETVVQKLNRFEAWEKENRQSLEKQHFEEEFKQSIPTIKELFPNATEAELDAIKVEVDKLSHTKEFHDKDLDYVVFKNKSVLSNFVSPKRKGMETRGRKEVGETRTEFDPDADLSKMSSSELVAWETEYRKSGKTDGLMTNASGKRILL